MNDLVDAVEEISDGAVEQREQGSLLRASIYHLTYGDAIVPTLGRRRLQRRYPRRRAALL